MPLPDEYEILIHKKKDAVVARVPALGIEARGANIGEAVNALDTASYPVEHYPADRGRAVRGSDIKRFAIKSSIITALIVIGGFLLSFQLNAILDNAIYTLQTAWRSDFHIGGSTFWGRVEKELDSAAESDKDLPPDKKAKLISDLWIIADRWRPAIAAVESAFADNPGKDGASAPTTK